MRARIRQFYEDINDSFWLRPALIVLTGLALAEILINLERSHAIPTGFMSQWLYSGGETGARTLLGAVAGSTIGVAGTVFSITIATLTLASNQMGPRLLRNFTRDRGNQATLGIYLGTFAYALIVLRSVRGADQGAFVPHMAITGALALALLCVAMLIYFVNHVANRINFDTVIELVYRDLSRNIEQLTTDIKQLAPPAESLWDGGAPVVEERSGYVQQLDEDAIADWAEKNAVSLRLRARNGDFVFPGAPIAVVKPPIKDAHAILRSAIVLGAYPTASMDIEFTVGQLVDIAVRALSPGINDPKTAVRVLDRLGAALCEIVARPLLTGVVARNGRVVFQRDATTYDGLTDAMFHTIRQSAAGVVTVLVHMLDVLTKVASVETEPARIGTLEHHAKLVLEDGLRSVKDSADKKNLSGRMEVFEALLETRASDLKRPAA